MGIAGFLLFIFVVQPFDPEFTRVHVQPNLPDLVIERVSFHTRLSTPKYTPGQPRRGSDGVLVAEFVLLIRNIGSASFSETFSISMAEGEGEIGISTTVNYSRQIIGPGGILEVTLSYPRWTRPAFKSGTLVYFRIQPPYSEGSLPRYEEERYDNNEFQWLMER